MDPVPETHEFSEATGNNSTECSPKGKVSWAENPARSTSEDEVPHWELELRRALARLATAIVRGSGAGLTIRGGLHAASGARDVLRDSCRNSLDCKHMQPSFGQSNGSAHACVLLRRILVHPAAPA